MHECIAVHLSGKSNFHSSYHVQEKDLKINQEASFAVQRNGVRGVIEAKVHAPSGVVEECYVTELDSGTLF